MRKRFENGKAGLTMNIKPIKNEKDYRKALVEINRIFDAKPNTPDGDYLDVLSTLVEKYEDEHYHIDAPDPVEALQYFMESRGLDRVDLEVYIGGSGRVSEVLNRKRSLSLSMIRKLHFDLGVPAEALLKEIPGRG